MVIGFVDFNIFIGWNRLIMAFNLPRRDYQIVNDWVVNFDFYDNLLFRRP